MIRNYNAYLLLALFGHDGHCITIAIVSLQFKRYYFNINTKFNHSQRSHIFHCSKSTLTIPTNIIIIQVIAISLNIVLFFCLFHFWVRLGNMEGFQPYYNFDWDDRMLNLAYNMFAIFQNWRSIYAFAPHLLYVWLDLIIGYVSNHIKKLFKWLQAKPYSNIFANSKIEVQFVHSRANIIHNTIVFFWDLWRAIGHIEHLLKRDSSLNSLSWLPIFKLYICLQTWSTTP